MVLELSEFNDSPEVTFKEFKTPAESEVSFSPLMYKSVTLLTRFEAETLKEVEEFMENLYVRVTLCDIYAASALREMEQNAFIEFEKAPEYKKQEKRNLFFEDILKIKLKVKKDVWAFTTNDRAFTPTKTTKLKPTTKIEVTVSPGFYYTETHCGLYLTVKNLVFVKASKAKKE